MFSYFPNLKTFSQETLTIDQLISLIKKHPYASKIERIRSIEYKCEEYKKIKETLPCVTSHGYFKGLKKDDLLCMSGYLYFDIDGFTCEQEMQITINKLNQDFKISMICKSCGGLGISMLIRVLGLNENNFVDTYNYVGYLLKNKGYNIDTAASGLSRKMIISFDLNVIYNKDKYLKIDNNLIDKYIKESKKYKKNKVSKKEVQYTLNDTLIDNKIIPLTDLQKTIKFELSYDKRFDGDFVIDAQDSYKIFIPKKINDGDKHRVFVRIIYALHFINNNINSLEVFSFLYYVNNTATPKMEIGKLRTLVNNLCTAIKNNGSVSLKTRTKKIHFNQNSDLTIKQKQSMSAKINGQLKTNITIDNINDAKQELVEKNEKPTQKNVAIHTGLSIGTVKRRWNQNKVPIEELNITHKKEENTIWNLSPDSVRDPFDVYENEQIRNENEEVNNDDFFDFEGD